MIKKFIFHSTFIAAVICLLILGYWQLQRLQWKNDLISSIELNYNSKTIDFPILNDADNKYEYMQTHIEGKFMVKQSMFFFRSNLRGESGYEIVVPFKTTLSKDVYVIIGWIPFDKKDEIDLKFIDDSALTKIEGSLIYSKKRKPLIPDNDISSNVWYLMNSEEMDIVNNLNSSNYLLKITDKNYFPQILIEFEPTNITNNHLQYAGTWFLLALVNTIMYIYFIYRKVH